MDRPFLAETVGVVQEGADPLAFDKAMLNFGYPVGGITLGDEVGIDVSAKVVKNLSGDPKDGFLGVRMEGSDLTILDDMVAAGLLGKKAGKGWLDYSGKGKGPKPLNAEAKAISEKYRHPTRDISKQPIDEVFERCYLRFIQEAALCVQDGVIGSPREADIGAVFGVGFPPFLGGPFMWIDAVGAQTVVDKMSRLQDEHGARFEPPQLLVDYAKGNKLFHP